VTVLIDLASYLDEVEAFLALADGFIERASVPRVQEAVRDLKTGIELGEREWTWCTRNDVLFRASRHYDGPNKAHADTTFELGFTIQFRRLKSTKKRSTVWSIANGSTRVTVRKGDRELPFHFDYKNSSQWGPQLHFQVHERIGDLAIPRICSTAFLPTDCADLMLAELHHEDWRATQAAGSNSRHVGLIRDAQENRSRAYIEDVARLWRDGARSRTRLTMLQDYTASVVGLPDHRGRVAAF